MNFNGNGCCGDDGEKDSSSINNLQSSHNEDVDNFNEDRRIYSRHTPYQTQVLEAENPQLNDYQRLQLSREIGLSVQQIKFWYQNKKAQTKARVDRADNTALRADNERIRNENEALKEALNTILCPACGGPSFGRDSYLDKLLITNAQLKQQHERLSQMVANSTGKLPILMMESVRPNTAPSMRNDFHNVDVGGLNHHHQQQGIFFGSCSSCSSAPAPAPAPVGLIMSDNNLLIQSSSSSNAQEQVVETDNNNAGVVMEKGPSSLEELMKRLA